MTNKKNGLNIFSAVALLTLPIGAVRLEFREAGSLAVHPLWKELKFVSQKWHSERECEFESIVKK